MIATGLRADGYREVLGVDVGDSENEAFWTDFLRGFRDRGLAGVRLVVSDAHAGPRKAIRRVLQGAAWQRSSVNMDVEQEVPACCLRRRERTLAA